MEDSIYNHLKNGTGDISENDLIALINNINKFDPCGRETLKSALKNLLPSDGTIIKNTDIDNIECINNDLKREIKEKGFKTREEIDLWCAQKFNQDYKWLNNLNAMVKKLYPLDLVNAKILKDNFNFIDEDGKELTFDKIIFEDLPDEISAPPRYEDALEEGDLTGLFGTTGGANASGKKVRLNLLKNSSGVPVLFTALPHTDYLTKRWRGEPATYSSSTSSNPADCSPNFNSGLDKRHIKPWTPREHGSSASTVNAMSHLRRMATQPRITQVELGSLGPLLARGFMGGSMDGGAQLDVDFTDCPSENKKGDKLSVRQSEQYANLFKSVVQRLDKHNTVSETVVNELKTDLEEYRRKECKLFQDAFRLANALKSQNNGSLPDKQPITSLDAFKEASDEVAKSETHLLGCLTKILTETCKKP
jgi:hypothetical protein